MSISILIQFTPEVIAIIILLFDFLGNKDLKAGIRASLSDITKGHSSEEQENAERLMIRKLGFESLKERFFVPTLIAFSSLVSFMAKADNLAFSTTILLCFSLAIIFFSIDAYIVNKSKSSKFSLTRWVHFIISLVLIVLFSVLKFESIRINP